MKVMAQIAMVMNLDKCIGCHTCSVTCKQAWTNREGTEYMWFNNVETRPGVGYPRGWEDQERWRGGWKRTRSGKLVPYQGGRLATLGKIFANPNLPAKKDYYEPWTYEYDQLLASPSTQHIPTARAKSALTGEHKDTIDWGPNWDDDLGGSMETLDQDPVLHQMNLTVRKSIEDSFMFYLPRICEHCLNPTCVSACPSGAIYKRAEDGIVLVDQDHCRGWRMCVSGCPYKKVFFNHHSGKAEKCTLCYPRLEVGQPTVCSETCVGRLRYLGCSSTTPTTSPGPHLSPTHVPCTPPRETSSSTPTTPKSSHKPRPTASHTLGSKQPRRHRYGSSSAAIRLPYPCTLSTEHCRWSGTYHLCHQSSTLSALRATTGKITECCWPRFPRCAFRLSISPAYSLLEPRLQLSSHFVVWLQCAPTCETSFGE